VHYAAVEPIDDQGPGLAVGVHPKPIATLPPIGSVILLGGDSREGTIARSSKGEESIVNAKVIRSAILRPYR
jgi:hypothetical protein